MPDPSEHSEHVTEFVNARMQDLEDAVNGDELSHTDRLMMKMVFRGQGYVREDCRARLDEHENRHHKSAWSRWRRGQIEPQEVAALLGAGGVVALIVDRFTTIFGA